MRILTNFKDYYDFVAYQYGVDDSITYVRNDKMLLTKEQFNEYPIKEELCNNEFYYKSRRIKFKTLLILGRMYIYVTEYTYNKHRTQVSSITNRIPNLKDFIHMEEYFKQKRCWYWKTLPDEWYKKEQLGYILPVVPELLDYQKTIKIPVLSGIKKDHDGNCIAKIPNLSTYQGFAGKYAAHTLYQNIYNFFIDIRNNKDLELPVILDNISTLEKHGFDKCTSFRHPTRIPQKKRKEPRRKIILK